MMREKQKELILIDPGSNGSDGRKKVWKKDTYTLPVQLPASDISGTAYGRGKAFGGTHKNFSGQSGHMQ